MASPSGTHVVLYRAWRPASFSEVVGQRHVTITLVNALRSNRLSHAYLFCGPRGTGKTSVAKILAKAANCPDQENGEPCNKCPLCVGIASGQSLDVLEIDAASNRGIDEIRDLREKVRYSSAACRYKVYIIDEVHMLTPEAFNALLKTLEEPPPNVLFILATTDPHKVPTTIVSRCQRFNFHRLSVEEIVDRLGEVCSHLGIATEDGVLEAIARHADGGLRDALGLLDQCLLFSGEGDGAGGSIKHDDLRQLLGLADEDALLGVLKGWGEGDPLVVLKVVDRLHREGKDLRQFTRDLIGICRDLLLMLVSSGSQDAETLGDQKWLVALSKVLTAERLVEMLPALSRLEGDLRWATQPRLSLEVGLLGLIFETGRYRPQQRQRTEDECPVPQAPAPLAASSGDESSESSESSAGFGSIMQQWRQIIERVKKQRRPLSALLEPARPVRLENGKLLLAFGRDWGFHKEMVADMTNRTFLEKAIGEVTGQRVAVICIFENEIQAHREEDLVEAALREFEGVLVDLDDKVQEG